jgi:uncharacterized protein YcnI
MSLRQGTIATGLLLLFAGPAAGHVTLEVGQAPASSVYRGTFRVPHGCEGATTTPLVVRLPEGISAARPMQKAGWTIRLTSQGEPASDHGALPEAAEIAWEGGNLPDAYHEEFVIRLRLPERPREIVYIPVVPECKGGSTAAWVQIPEPGRRITEYRFTVPAVRLLPRN